MNFDFDKVWASKAAYRRRLAALPFGEKIRILEQLRERAEVIQASAIKAGLRKPDPRP